MANFFGRLWGFLNQPIGLGGSGHTHDQSPLFNVDGTPMCGYLDMNGNPYGFTSPAVNIDGSPMVGGVDIHGNPYGVTDTRSNDSFSVSGGIDSWDCSVTGSGSFRSWDSGCGGNFDSWSSSSGSSFDNSW